MTHASARGGARQLAAANKPADVSWIYPKGKKRKTAGGTEASRKYYLHVCSVMRSCEIKKKLFGEAC